MVGARRAAVVISLLLGSGVAHAEDAAVERAAELFRAGSAAYEHGDYRAAARAFEEANSQAPAAATKYNAGLAWEAAGDPLRAADDYEQALSAGGLGAAEASDAHRRLLALDASLGHLHVVAPNGARIEVDHSAPRAAPFELRVKPGTHSVEMRLDARHERTSVAVIAGHVTQVRFERSSPTTTSESSTPAAEPSAAPPADETPAGSGSSQRTLGWVALGGGVVLGGVAGYLGVRALDARDQFNADHTDAAAHDRAQSLRLWTNVTLAGAVVAAGSGIVLLLTVPSKNPATEARLVVGPGSLRLDGRF